MEVVDEATGAEAVFPCSRWLDSSEGDRATELLLPAAGRGGPGADGMCTYLVAVTTSDVKFGGTDANVFVELLGSRSVQGCGYWSGSEICMSASLFNQWNCLVLHNVGAIAETCQ